MHMFCIEKKKSITIQLTDLLLVRVSFLYVKSVVQLKLFDNIFSDLDDAPNVLSFISCHSHRLTIPT